MKTDSNFNAFYRHLAAMIFAGSLVGTAHADTLIYSDTSPTPGQLPITDGSGTVSSSTTIFYDSTSSTASVAPGTTNILQFGDNGANSETGAAGTITVSGTVSTDGLTFEDGASSAAENYTFSGGTGNSISFQGSAPSISVTSGESEILNVGLTTASGSTLTISGSGTGTTQVSFGSTATGGLGNSANDSFGGGLVLSNYVLLNANSAGLSGLTALTSASSTTIRYYDGSNFSTATNYTIAGTGDNSSRGALSYYGANTVTATLGGTITLTGAAQINARDNVTANGNISGAYALTLENELNSNVYTLNGNNSSLTGGLISSPTVGEETIKAGTSSTSAFGTGVVSLMGGTGGTAVQIDLNGQSLTTGGLGSGTTETFVGNSGNGASTAATLTLNPGSAQTFAGVIENGTTTAAYASSAYTNTQVGGGTTALTISSGTQTLTGANTYTGATTISNGATLNLSGGGSLAAGSTAATTTEIVDNGTFNNYSSGTTKTAFTLGAAQELAGSGTVGSQVNTVSGSMINPGSLATAGKLTMAGGLDITTAGAQLNFRLNSVSTSDDLAITGGAFTQSSGTVVNLFNGGSFAGAGTYSILDASALGMNDVTLADYSLGTTIAGYTETLAVNGSDNVLQVQVSTAPEPSTRVLLGGGLLVLTFVASRRRFKFAS